MIERQSPGLSAQVMTTQYDLYFIGRMPQTIPATSGKNIGEKTHLFPLDLTRHSLDFSHLVS